MAALIPSYTSPIFELNGRAMRTFTVSVTSDAAEDEWIVTGLGILEGVLGFAVLGTAAPVQNTTDPTELPVFGLNLAGTGGDVTNGALGIEVFSVDQTIQVTVVGRLQA